MADEYGPDTGSDGGSATGTGAAHTFPMQCSVLRKNGFVMMKGHPCKIVDMTTSKTGKHGHAKVNLVGVDIFTGKKYEDMSPWTHNMEVPNVQRKDYPLLNVEDGLCQLMDDNGDVIDDFKLPDDNDADKSLSDDIKKMFENGVGQIVTVLSAMGEEKIVATKPEE